MSAKKVTVIGLVVLIIFSLFVSPAFGYGKHRPNPLGPPRWLPVNFGKPRKARARSAVPKKSETRKSDLAAGAIDAGGRSQAKS